MAKSRKLVVISLLVCLVLSTVLEFWVRAFSPRVFYAAGDMTVMQDSAPHAMRSTPPTTTFST